MIEAALRNLESFQEDPVEYDQMNAMTEDNLIKVLNNENKKLHTELNKINEIINSLIVLKKNSITLNKGQGEGSISSTEGRELMQLHIESMKKELHMQKMEYKSLVYKLKQTMNIEQIQTLESNIESIDSRIKQLRREKKQMIIKQIDRGKLLDRVNTNEVFDEVNGIKTDLANYNIQIDELESRMLKNSVNLQAKNWNILKSKAKYERLLREGKRLDVFRVKSYNEYEEVFNVVYRKKEALEKNIASYKSKEQTMTYDYKQEIAQLEKKIDAVIKQIEDKAMYFVAILIGYLINKIKVSVGGMIHW
jgi:hypothetical protein